MLIDIEKFACVYTVFSFFVIMASAAMFAESRDFVTKMMYSFFWKDSRLLAKMVLIILTVFLIIPDILGTLLSSIIYILGMICALLFNKDIKVRDIISYTKGV